MMRRLYTLLFMLLTLALGANAQSRYAEHSKLASGKWVKIRVADEGVYQISSATLKSMGFSNPDKVCLYGYNLPMLPETNLEELDDDLTELPLFRKTDGTLLFYSCGTIQWTRKNASSAFTHSNNPYSNYVYYFLTETSGTPATFEQTGTETTMEATQTSYLAHVLYEQDAFSFINAGRMFFDSYDFANGATKTYKLNFDAPASGDVTLDVQFAASSSSSLNVSVGSNTLGTLSISEPASYSTMTLASRSFTLYDQTASSLDVTLRHVRTTSMKGHLDYIRATYETPLSLTGKNYMVFTATQDNTAAFQLQGVDNATRIWNITNNVPTEQVGTRSGSTFKAVAYGIENKYVAVNTNATFPSPQVVGTVANQDLHALDSINLLIIVPANGKLTAQAQRLADAHTSIDGIKCAVVRADQVYNEFSSGAPDATAYRRMMKMFYDKQYTASPLTGTEKGSLNLLLFGNCMWDNRFVTSGLSSKSQDDYLLAYESMNSWSHTDSYVAEEYFTLLADGKGVSPLKEKPDCGVGRLPLSTETEAKNVVDKIITYMQNLNAGAWKNTICLMADDDKTIIHMEDAENVLSNTESLFPDYHYKRIYWDAYERTQSATGNSYPDVYAEINKVMEEGALIMDYTGHGAAYTLSHEQVLTTPDFQKWTSPRIPVWITAACDVTPFDMNTENLGCEAILNKQGAAVAFIGTARTVYSSPNRIINRNFMSHVLATKNNGEHFTIGEALAQAKADIVGSKSYYSKIDTINKAHFVLLGDPALKLITPTYKVKIDKFNGQSVDAENPPTISAGETITVEGHIVDAQGEPATNFDGTVSPTVYDSEEHIVGNNNMGIEEVFEYDDRTRVLYAGTDSVKAGTFKFTFPVPLDINYSDESGLIVLYAINTEKTLEANGKFEDFLVGGTATEEITDTEGPSIATFSDGQNVANISYTSETPTLRIELSDESGINTTGNGLGHDIVAIIDGNEATTYTLNNYYTQSVGDYRSGTVVYTLPTLSAGKHSLVVRAFDTLNNLGEESYSFEVVTGLTQLYDIYDMSGRKVYSSTERTPSLPKGIYIRHTRLTSPKGDITTSSEKFIITQ
ncbi:MAG: type IX secretion system sortase PorU [Bacteroidaceae bacterium]|nr:type IX secretion system sortase PorU [Bacteroidaceae bacterium]